MSTPLQIGYLTRWVERPGMREWCVENEVDTDQLVLCQPMRGPDGAAVTWVRVLDTELPMHLRVDRPIQRKIAGWPPLDTWPTLIAEAVRKAGQLDPPGGSD